MQKPRDRRELDSLERDALDWVILLTSGAATAADAEELRRWRGRSANHEAAFARAVELRQTLQRAGREFAEDGAAQARAVAQPVQTRSAMGRRAFLGGALAASAAGVMVVRPPMDLWPSYSEMSADFRTGTGEQRHLALDKGISLALNTRTSIALRSTPSGSSVELISGEAEVTASVESGAPFATLAAGGRTLARHARFTIRADQDTACVTCLEGTVAIERDAGKVDLQPGQQMTYSRDAFGPVETTDTEIVTAWRRGLLIFHDRPLAEVVEEVNRYRPGRIILADAALGRLPVNGVFHLDRIEGVIEQIDQLGARVTSLPGGIVLLS